MRFYRNCSCFIVSFVLSLISLSLEVDEPTKLVGETDDDSFYFNCQGSEPNEVYEIRTNLSAFKNYTIHILNIPENFGFIIVQVHGYIHEIALAPASNLGRGNVPVKGTSVGLVESKPVMGAATFELSNLNPLKVSVMINIIGYSKTAPVPGGCNMVFNQEVAPYLQLNYSDTMIEVVSQPAMSRIKDSNCNLNSLTYEIYHIYQLERDFSMESYFKFLRLMMTVDSIRAHGRKVLPPLVGTNQKNRYSAYPGTGSVYAVIVSETQQGETKSAAYVPIHTYACSTIRLRGSCNVLNNSWTKTVAVTIFCLGMFLCIRGHASPNAEMYITSSLLIGVLVAYHFHDAVSVVRPLVSGLGFGLMWLLIWSCCCSSYVSRISNYVASGVVLTSFFFHSGIGDTQVLENDTNFWLLFGSLTLLSVVIFHVGHHRTCVLGSSIVGAYLTIIPIDHYVGSNLKYAFVNTMRRAVVENFNLATLDPPFQFRDMIIAALFLLLVVIGYTHQIRKLKRQSDNGHFSTHHLYFEPSYNESTPVLTHGEPPLSSPYPWWFDATSPGSDSVFTSPHPQTQRNTVPYIGNSYSSPTVVPDSNLRFIPASLRCNPNLRQEALRRASAETSTPRKTTVQNDLSKKTSSPAVTAPKMCLEDPNQFQTPDCAKYPKVPRAESDSDSDNESGPNKVPEGPPPPYANIYP